MSFMFNPHPYDDPTAINRPKLEKGVISSIISGTSSVAEHIKDVVVDKLKSSENKLILAFDGYIGAQWHSTLNLVSQQLKLNDIKVSILDFSENYKPGEQLDRDLFPYLEEDKEKDPVLLFGKLFKGGFESLIDEGKLNQFKSKLTSGNNNSAENEVLLVYGCGCSIEKIRALYDLVFYYDVTPKKVILRARKGDFANLGDRIAKPIKALLRRCYYVDFEVAGHLRWDLIKNDSIDFYIDSNEPDNLKLIPRNSFKALTSALIKYPLRCKPVYLEGVWGGHYITRLRNLPKTMRNCAWVFDLIPLEVSLQVEAGENLLDIPFFTFVQKEGERLMGRECVEKYNGYFPIRFNYDDSFHSSGNMSIQLHSGHEYNVENYNELGRQDESYYIVAAGHGAKTYIGFHDDVNPDDFIKEVKTSEKMNTPVDYQKYISHVESQPGIQVMLPEGTIHSSGQNQVILEIGSLTVGSYTYKMYDYLRADFDGKPRPIHTWHGEKVLRKNANFSWVKENLVHEPEIIRKGDGWSESIVGQHDLLYFSLRRLEFENSIEDDTKGIFHVLTLVDGEGVLIQSLDNPELCYHQNYLDVVVVPAIMGKYKIINKGNQPINIHKTLLKDGFTNDGVSDN